jgi:hypothetical protein
MKLETKTRGIGLPGMEALSFTMSVAHGGIGVATTGCGGKHCFLFFYPLFRFASVFLFFLFTLLSLSFSFFSRLFSSLYFLLLLPFFFLTLSLPLFSLPYIPPLPVFLFFSTVRFLLWLL